MKHSFKPWALALFATASLTLAALSFVPPALADEDGDDEIVFDTEVQKSLARFVGELPDQTQTIATQAMLVALGVEPEKHLEGVEKAREYFLRVYKILLEGDVEHNISPTQEPKVLEALAELESLWQPYDVVISKGLAAGGFNAEQVPVIAQLSAPLFEAAKETAEAYEGIYAEAKLRSILVPMTEESGRQGVRVQEMFRDYLLIAYGHEAGARRQSLAVSAKDFEAVLTGLIQGDPERRLMAAVNVEIGSQMHRVQLAWQGLQPHMKQAAEGGQIDRNTLLQVTELVEEVVEEMEQVVDLYDDL